MHARRYIAPYHGLIEIMIRQGFVFLAGVLNVLHQAQKNRQQRSYGTLMRTASVAPRRNMYSRSHMPFVGDRVEKLVAPEPGQHSNLIVLRSAMILAYAQ